MTWQSDDEPHVVTSLWCVFRQDELTFGCDTILLDQLCVLGNSIMGNRHTSCSGCLYIT
jgi:hypothetical protein